MKNKYKNTIQVKDAQFGFKVKARVSRIDEKNHLAFITLMEGPNRESTYSVDINRVK